MYNKTITLLLLVSLLILARTAMAQVGYAVNEDIEKNLEIQKLEAEVKIKQAQAFKIRTEAMESKLREYNSYNINVD